MIFFSECLLHFGVLRVFVLLCVFVCVRAILSLCPLTWHVYIVYKCTKFFLKTYLQFIIASKKKHGFSFIDWYIDREFYIQ